MNLDRWQQAIEFGRLKFPAFDGLNPEARHRAYVMLRMMATEDDTTKLEAYGMLKRGDAGVISQEDALITLQFCMAALTQLRPSILTQCQMCGFPLTGPEESCPDCGNVRASSR